MSELPINFLDAITIKYECPKCGHMQKQTFLLKRASLPMKFACKKCNFENEMTIARSEDA